MKSQGATKRKIAEKFGFGYEQAHNFISRYNRNQRKFDTGIVLRRKDRRTKKSVYIAGKRRYISKFQKN